MKYKIVLITSLLFALSACTIFRGNQESQANIYDFNTSITEEGLRADLTAFAHDSLEGRETGTEGLQKAADILARGYKAYGLIPAGDDNSYFQHFDLVQNSANKYVYRLQSTADQTTIDESELSKDEDEFPNFITLYGGSDPLSGEVIFAGYGIKDDENGINHFPQADEVEGKWVMVLYERGLTDMRTLQTYFGNGGSNGLILVMDIQDPSKFDEQALALKRRLGSPGRMQLKYLQSDNEQPSVAINRVHPLLAARMLEMDSPDSLLQYSNKIKENPGEFKARALPYSVEHEPYLQEQTITTKNVAAFLEGSDPELKDEVVVLSSHYDHVGIGQPDSTGDAIYNGADDDGSGTIATLHAAQAMARAKKAGAGPRRSVLFLNVSGEEKGLLGSRYYSDHPIYSVENTVANINIDMIGRVDAEHVDDSSYVYIIGAEIISSGLDSLTQSANARGINLELSKKYNDLEDPNQFYRRSDHWNFGRLGIPFVFFFTGTHPDYHRPGDEAHKITYGPYLQRTRLVYNLTAEIANADERPVVDNQEFIEKTQASGQ